MLLRHLQTSLSAAAARYPVVSVTGPRQSGKTTLVRAAFPEHRYFTLEDPDRRAFAHEDPRGFLALAGDGVILDEVQRVPELFSYLQGVVDADDRPGRFVLTGSQNFLLLEKISQSLAGRCAVLHLLPFSQRELAGQPPAAPETIGAPVSGCAPPPRSLMETLFTGFYPRIHDKELPPGDWLRNYFVTYLERDVRSLANIGDLEAFGLFVRLCAGRSGQLVNFSALAADCGITHTTARRWLSVLETSFLVVRLPPHHRNFNKRLIKSPKLYFLDTGLLCFLLGIGSAAELEQHAARGAVFESFVVAELYKTFLHQGLQPPLYFWRDVSGHEVDVVVERRSELVAVEVKSGRTVAADFTKGLRYWRGLAGDPASPAALVYGGDEAFVRSGISIVPWYTV